MTIPAATNWTEPLVELTAVIAVATVAYFVSTVFLWRSTKKAADAAKEAADATKEVAEESKKSTDLLAALNRPYMGVHRVGFVMGPNSQNNPVWQIASEIRNFGTLPALTVEARLEFLINVTVLFALDGPSSAEVFPQSEAISIVAGFPFSGPNRDAVAKGEVTLIARTTITYAASNGQRYVHQADARYNRGYGTFLVIASETKFVR